MKDGEWVDGCLPLVEGKCPPISRMRSDGTMESCYPIPDPDYVDEELRETDEYFLSGKEEYWGYETVCKKCSTCFMAYNLKNDTGYNVRNYCPGCGAKLTD